VASFSITFLSTQRGEGGRVIPDQRQQAARHVAVAAERRRSTKRAVEVERKRGVEVLPAKDRDETV
jgi:hypothetical protein